MISITIHQTDDEFENYFAALTQCLGRVRVALESPGGYDDRSSTNMVGTRCLVLSYNVW